MISQVPVSTSERIQMLAAAALLSGSETITAPRPVGFMLSFEQLRELDFGDDRPTELLEAEAPAVEPRFDVPSTASEPAKGRHWREVMAGSAGFSNRRRTRARSFAS